MAITPADLRAYTGAPASITDAQLTQFLEFAHVIVTEDMALCPMSDERREMIELNIAAHFTQQASSPGTSASVNYIKVGTSEERYATLNDDTFGLGTTRFGQTAIMLDPCGILVQVSSPKMKALFQVV